MTSSLVIDALGRVLIEPRCTQRWHRLMAIWERTADAAERQSVLDRLTADLASDPLANILRLTFLARTTGNPDYESEAARRTLDLVPEDADRLAACLAFRWLSALQDLDGREAFIAALNSGSAPELARRLALAASAFRPAGLQPRAADDIRRVAMVVPYVGHRFHTPSMMAVEQ